MNEEDLLNCFGYLFSSKEWIIALISGLLGSIIGAGGGAWATYYYKKKHTLELEEIQRLNLAKALSSELASIWDRYMVIAGRFAEKAADENNPPQIGLLETSQNYFIVFDSSANLLGMFEQNTITKIIETYINGKALLDELIEYGNLSDRYRDAFYNNKMYPELQDEMKQSFVRFKDRHFELKNIFEDTISTLNKVASRN